MTHLNGINKEDNKALVLHKANDLKLEIWPLDETLDANDVFLESKCNGICGTDIHLLKNGGTAGFTIEKPLVLGHEPSALVKAIGSNVKDLKPGDRVAVEPIIACAKCEYCRMGRYNLCPQSYIQSRGLPPMDGCIRKYYTHPSNCCFKIPDHLSWEEGSMVEPFAVVVHACRRVSLKVGERVLVCGAGPVGIMAMLCSKAFGATKVCITDINKSRLDLAKSLGADQVFLIDVKDFNDEKFAQNMNKDFGKIDKTIECSGVESSLSTAIYATRIGGQICLVGLGPKKVKVPISTAIMKEINLIGSCRIKDDYELAIELIASGKVNLKPLVTNKFKIDRALEAFELLKSNQEGVVKVMIEH
ncbi:sorbitol dehydrogenase-like [Oppia nitens]|uniref:sorbitol dehydrogenase-like n=1 Tax=Oppia nitens TaxID=1686743 RepID=UPI0023DC1E93|nr:sorbitol dehydrogenase-like [Oppia nitens]